MTQVFYPLSNSPILNASQWSKMAQNWLATGIIRGELNELQVFADSTGMQLKVKPGQAWIKGHFYESDTTETFSIGTADTTNPRIDRIIVRLDWVANSIQLAVLQGNPAALPGAPALTRNSSRWEISLAQITVGANVTTIASGNVTDERYFVKNANSEFAQLFKITSDDGGVKLSITDTTKNLLVELLALGKGMHTFYAVDGVTNLPKGKSARGIFHNTGSNNGWLMAMDYTNTLFTNYLINGTWDGWKTYGDTSQATLWTGNSSTLAMNTITPTKKLSDCKTGWLLVWSDYDPDTTTTNNYDFSFSEIPKELASKHSGAYCNFIIGNYSTWNAKDYVNKKLKVTDSTLVGHDDNWNSANSSDDVILRYILEY